ncbi:MAG: hypothetical protein MI864_21315 [Pseudomonadales bacterium]|nr:hypothetical protein [Pseudomonadales bacterium]
MGKMVYIAGSIFCVFLALLIYFAPTIAESYENNPNIVGMISVPYKKIPLAAVDGTLQKMDDGDSLYLKFNYSHNGQSYYTYFFGKKRDSTGEKVYFSGDFGDKAMLNGGLINVVNDSIDERQNYTFNGYIEPPKGFMRFVIWLRKTFR